MPELKQIPIMQQKIQQNTIPPIIAPIAAPELGTTFICRTGSPY